MYEVNTPLAPHRGVLILVLGILSLVFCTLTGPVAWSMGREDMAAIQAGHMDKSGEQMTQIGMTLGIVGTVLLVVQILALFFILMLSVYR